MGVAMKAAGCRRRLDRGRERLWERQPGGTRSMSVPSKMADGKLKGRGKELLPGEDRGLALPSCCRMQVASLSPGNRRREGCGIEGACGAVF